MKAAAVSLLLLCYLFLTVPAQQTHRAGGSGARKTCSKPFKGAPLFGLSERNAC